MARPKKQPHERRQTGVRADLTLAEKRYVQAQAALAGLSEAEYTRRRVLGYAVKAARGELRCDAALVSELNRLGVQLSNLGNLANQVARYLHTDRSVPEAWGVLPGELRRVLDQVEAKLAEALGDGA